MAEKELPKPLIGATGWEGISKKEVLAEGNSNCFYHVSIGHLIEPRHALRMTNRKEEEGEQREISLSHSHTHPPTWIVDPKEKAKQ